MGFDQTVRYLALFSTDGASEAGRVGKMFCLQKNAL